MIMFYKFNEQKKNLKNGYEISISSCQLFCLN